MLERARVLRLRKVTDPDYSLTVGVLHTSTPGLYLSRVDVHEHDEDCDPCCPSWMWGVYVEAGLCVVDYLKKSVAHAVAAALADVGIDWTSTYDEILALRASKSDAWQAAAALVELYRFRPGTALYLREAPRVRT